MNDLHPFSNRNRNSSACACACESYLVHCCTEEQWRPEEQLLHSSCLRLCSAASWFWWICVVPSQRCVHRYHDTAIFIHLVHLMPTININFYFHYLVNSSIQHVPSLSASTTAFSKSFPVTSPPPFVLLLSKSHALKKKSLGDFCHENGGIIS